jgi:hypothetical protein
MEYSWCQWIRLWKVQGLGGFVESLSSFSWPTAQSSETERQTMDVSQMLTPSSVFWIFQTNQGGVLFALVMRLSKEAHFPVNIFAQDLIWWVFPGSKLEKSTWWFHVHGTFWMRSTAKFLCYLWKSKSCTCCGVRRVTHPNVISLWATLTYDVVSKELLGVLFVMWSCEHHIVVVWKELPGILW